MAFFSCAIDTFPYKLLLLRFFATSYLLVRAITGRRAVTTLEILEIAIKRFSYDLEKWFR